MTTISPTQSPISVETTPLYSSITPFSYLLFLASSLLLFLGYLILPRGIKAQYFGTSRKRYRRQQRRQASYSLQSPGGDRRGGIHNSNSSQRRGWNNNHNTNGIRKTEQSNDVLETLYAQSHSFSPQDQLISPVSEVTKSDILSSQASAIQDDVFNGLSDRRDVEQSPSVQLSLPEELKNKLKQPPGIKLIAHGTKCKPRPVWITLHCASIDQQQSPELKEYYNCLTWRAEINSATSKKKLGNLRNVELFDIVGIELGKRSTALRRPQTTTNVKENDCFSLLTKTGTLDLQVVGIDSSTAEEVRAAFITCLALSMIASKRVNNLPSSPSSAAPSLQSQLDRLKGGSSQTTDERTIYSGILSEAISTVSF